MTAARREFDVDMALIEEIRTASTTAYCGGTCDEMGCRGHEDQDSDLRPWSDRERAKQTLAESILVQLGEEP